MAAGWIDGFLAAAWLLSLVVCFLWILRDPLSRRERVMYILLVGLVPYLGVAVYLLAVHWGSRPKPTT
jgi:hypothetical protein